MKKLITICAAMMLFSTSYARAGSWTILNVPGANDSTHISGIDGGNIVGYYGSSNNQHGFLYDGTNWTTLDMPTAPVTEIHSISGSNIVGAYSTGPFESWHGFLYNGTTWTTIDKPGAFETQIYGIDGGNIVGSYDHHGFLYDGINWSTIDYPGASRTAVYGIDGSNLVGSYDNHGFIYNMNTQSWTTIDAPGATQTCIYGIEGGNLIGRFDDTSFFYNGTDWLTDLPGSDAMSSPGGISGNTIVGTYYTYYSGDGGLIGVLSHGYVYTIPEPTALLLVGLGVPMLSGLRRKQ